MLADWWNQVKDLDKVFWEVLQTVLYRETLEMDLEETAGKEQASLGSESNQ